MYSTASPGSTRIGWIGTGVMGAAMAGHVMKAGYSLTCYNRTASKAQSLVDQGAVLAATPKEVAASSDVVFTIVGYPADVRSVILDPESGVLAGLQPGGIVVDVTTSEPGLAVEIEAAAQAQGKHSLDCPVTGGDMGAKNGTLTLFAGGQEKTLEFVTPVLDCFAKKISYFGASGKGQHCKAANQITICTTMIGMCEGIMYAHRMGLDVELYLKSIAGGAAGSASLNLYAPRIMKRDMAPGFYVEHFVKDLGIALGEAQKANLSLPGLALAQQLYVSLMANGDGRCGTQALIKALERMNGTEVPKLGHPLQL